MDFWNFDASLSNLAEVTTNHCVKGVLCCVVRHFRIVLEASRIEVELVERKCPNNISRILLRLRGQYIIDKLRHKIRKGSIIFLHQPRLLNRQQNGSIFSLIGKVICIIDKYAHHLDWIDYRYQRLVGDDDLAKWLAAVAALRSENSVWESEFRYFFPIFSCVLYGVMLVVSAGRILFPFHII